MHQLKYYFHVICERIIFFIIIILFFNMHIFKSFFQSNFNTLYIYILEVVRSDKDPLSQHGKIM
jgi:hypothetical protein